MSTDRLVEHKRLLSEHQQRLNERWEQGVPHEEASVRILRVLMAADKIDYFDWKKGGDGDNGETLQFGLDEYFATHPTEPLPCCETMKGQLSMVCDQHGTQHGMYCPDQLVHRGEYSGRLFLHAANATYDLLFCPWCGAHVQQSTPAV